MGAQQALANEDPETDAKHVPQASVHLIKRLGSGIEDAFEWSEETDVIDKGLMVGFLGIFQELRSCKYCVKDLHESVSH